MNEKFGDLIRRLREEKKYSVSDFSKLTGFSTTEIRNIELGKNKPRVFNLTKLASALGCDFDYLFNKLNENN